ncbi:hypothetical protein ACFLXQ_06630 [Chloroflexota bacterium]
MEKIIVSRAYGAEKAEVVINKDGSFMIGKNGPPYTIRNEPINLRDYGWDEVSILDTKDQVVMTGHVISGNYTFEQVKDSNMYRAAAQALWDL